MERNDRLVRSKENRAKARRGGEEREVFYEGDCASLQDNTSLKTGPSWTLATNRIFPSPTGR